MEFHHGSDEVLAWAADAAAKLMPSAVIQRRSITRAEAERKYETAGQHNLPDMADNTVSDNAITKQHQLEPIDYSKTKRVPQGVCKDFYETGYCRFGDACIYSHVREVDM